MEKTELYHFSSLIPKVKKSIKKYKKTYNGEFLSKVWKLNETISSPPKFLEPNKIYRFYGDLVTLDNPLSFNGSEMNIHQLKLHMEYKSISSIDVSDVLSIHLEDKFSEDYYPIELFIDRLNTLGDKDAHGLSESFTQMKENFKINKNEDDLNSTKCDIFNLEAVLSKEEFFNYQNMVKMCYEEFKHAENTYTWHMRKVFYKTQSHKKYGPVLNEIKFNKKVANLFINKKVEDFTYQDAYEIMNISANQRTHYFEFFNGMLQHGHSEICEFQGGLETAEGFYLPCFERIKKIDFKGQNYEEQNIFITFSVEQRLIEGLDERRRLKQLEEQNKMSVAKAKLKTKFKKIENIHSDSWKTLCVLYYGNAEGEENDDKNDNAEDYAKRFWANVDQTKVCKYRSINPT